MLAVPRVDAEPDRTARSRSEALSITGHADGYPRGMSRSRIIRLDSVEQFAAINVLFDPGQIGGPVVVPNCVIIRTSWSQADGKTARNIMFGRAAGVPSPTVAQAQAIFAAMTSGAAWTALQPYLATSTALVGIGLRSVHTAGQAEVLSTGGAVPGTGVGNALPNEVAACVKLSTAQAGPGHRGRIYLPGFVQTANTAANVIDPAAVTAINTWVAGFTTIFAAQGYTWVIGLPARQAYTGSTGTQHPARVATSEAVTQAALRNNTWDSQRRRGLK